MGREWGESKERGERAGRKWGESGERVRIKRGEREERVARK